MSNASFKFEKSNRSLMERLFEPPAVGQMSPAAKVVAYILLVFWSIFVHLPDLLGGHHVLQGCGGGQPGALLHSLRGLPAEPRCLARASSTAIPIAIFHRSLRQFVPAVLQCLRLHRVSPVVTLAADGAADLQDLSGLHQFHRGQHRGNRPLRGDRLHGGLCAGPRAVQAEVRQHRDVRAADAPGDRRHQLSPASPGGCPLPWRSPCSSSWPAPSASISSARWAMATSCSGSFPSASCRRSS